MQGAGLTGHDGRRCRGGRVGGQVRVGRWKGGVGGGVDFFLDPAVVEIQLVCGGNPKPYLHSGMPA